MPLSGLALGAPAIVGLGERIAAAVRGVQQQLLNMRRSRLPDFFRRLPSARLLVTEFGASVLARAWMFMVDVCGCVRHRPHDILGLWRLQ